MKYKID